ncbi:MAG: 4-(cytidine 5'-diphospho)-2-C-methyl-D-erythritol kinase [Candidatus Cloacimonetes bacterium]|nr:4-(cytidine 5'-diphospho)-2-C-methyl-D-erythritol kinase [Candidatus Cloacimonadota bacterium]
MLAASYAKINLSLEVLGKLPQGYHRIETLFASIDLYDGIRFALTKTPSIKLWCNLKELSGTNNLIFRVADYLLQEYRPAQGIRIELEKRIPIAAGLGGGSSNAAITLVALNRLWELNLSSERLEAIAAAFGSDINFFLHGGCCLGEDRGQEITALDDISISNILLVNPGLQIPSAEAYRLVDVESISQPHSYRQTIRENKFFNRLEPGIRARYPLIDAILRQMTKAGAHSALLSGSGSTCFGIYDNINALNKARAEFEAQGFWTHPTKTIGKEEYQKCTQNLS